MTGFKTEFVAVVLTGFMTVFMTGFKTEFVTRVLTGVMMVFMTVLSSSGPGPGPRSGPGQVPGQVQKVQGLRAKDLDLG